MSRRQVVPVALREELTEYSSLLRALKTSHSLDLLVNLTEPYVKNRDGEIDSDNDDDEQHSTSAIARTDVQAGIGSGFKRKHLDTESKHWRNRDQWTRWPIPTKDVPPPDWSLQDEIREIIERVLFSDQEFDSPSFDEGGNEYNDNENKNDGMGGDPSMHTRQDHTRQDQPEADIIFSDCEDERDMYVHGLVESMTPVIQCKLESLFALISAHTIARSDSMQNRIEPFDWRDLLNILGSPAARHLVDETCVVPCSFLIVEIDGG